MRSMRTAMVYSGRSTDVPRLKTVTFPNILKPSSKRRRLTELTDNSSSSCEELFDKGSGGRRKTSNNPAEHNDHSYLCVQKSETSLLVKRLEVPITKLEKLVPDSEKAPVRVSSAFKENVTPLDGLNVEVPEPSAPGRVKKKRGRKPGRKAKSTDQAIKDFFAVTEQIDYGPYLRHIERYPHLIYYDFPDDDKFFIDKRYRDVMWSSTLPSLETPEFLMLKDLHLRTCYRSRHCYRKKN